ncbi:kelch-like protein 6 [Haematobia irritans]|uniref:kelch-like protein 6 n=1 Tax=Haematobia irritans TaxID=7368 RepID=UPI003F509ACA
MDETKDANSLKTLTSLDKLKGKGKVLSKLSPRNIDSKTDDIISYQNSQFSATSESSESAESKNEKEVMVHQLNSNALQQIKPASGQIASIRSSEESLRKHENNPSPDSIGKSLFDMGLKTNEVENWENIYLSPKNNLYELMRDMLENHLKPSVLIRIDKFEFHCHLIVLRCYSEFFMDVKGGIDIIDLPPETVTTKAFTLIYEWMLADKPQIQREGFVEVFNAANFLGIKQLVHQCWCCLDNETYLTEDTAFALYWEARNYNLQTVEQLMMSRICKFFLTLVASKEFLHLSCKELCKLLSANTIGVNSEVEVLMAAVRWLSYKWKERKPFILDVISCVRFGLMPPIYLVTLNKDLDCPHYEGIFEIPEIKKMIQDGLLLTTNQSYYAENTKEFLHQLEKYNLVAPAQRLWIYDPQCNYHSCPKCPNWNCFTYKSFLEYLEMITTNGMNYWRTLETFKDLTMSEHYCGRKNHQNHEIENTKVCV